MPHAHIHDLKWKWRFNKTWWLTALLSYQLLLLAFMPCLIPCGFRFWNCCDLKSCACELCEHLGVTQSKLSFHLKTLKRSRFGSLSTGRTLDYYSLNLPQFVVLEQYLAEYRRSAAMLPARPCRLCSFTGFAPHQHIHCCCLMCYALTLSRHESIWNIRTAGQPFTIGWLWPSNALTRSFYQVDEFMKWLGSTPWWVEPMSVFSVPHLPEAPTNGRRPFSDWTCESHRSFDRRGAGSVSRG